MTKAIALIAGPIVCAALFFHLETSGPRPGVYVEVGRGSVARTFSLAGNAADPRAPLADLMALAVASPTGSVGAFVVVSEDAASAAKSAATVQLRFLVVDTADAAFAPEPLTVPATTTLINPRVYRVTSPAFGESAVARSYYRDVMTHAGGSRSTLELLVTLVVQDPAGQRRIHAVQIGPTP